jgi:hypothetical protein
MIDVKQTERQFDHSEHAVRARRPDMADCNIVRKLNHGGWGRLIKRGRADMFTAGAGEPS